MNTESVTKTKSANKDQATPKNPTPATLHLNRRTNQFNLKFQLDEDSIIKSAKQILARRFKRHSPVMDRPQFIKDFLLLNMAGHEREVFGCLFLDTKYRLIAFETLFYGSIHHSYVDAREVIKRSLAHNAAAVMLVHNHPSGNCQPSPQDRRLTERLKRTLHSVDVRLIDHFIVGGKEVLSMAERNMLSQTPPEQV